MRYGLTCKLAGRVITVSNERKIIWVASYPKSGNTWVRVFLYQYYHDNQCSDINKLNELIPPVSEKKLYLDANGGEEPDNADYARLREPVFRNIISSWQDNKPLLLKNHNARARHLKRETVPTELTSKAIYIVRNPLDVVDSLANHTGLSIDGAVQLMCEPGAIIGGAGTSGGLEILTTWSQHVMSWVYGAQQYPTLVIRYEDLLTQPDLSFRNIVSFLEWPVFEDQLELSISNASFDRLKAFEHAHGFNENPHSKSRQFFRRGQSDRWQSVLSRSQIDRIIQVHGTMMERLGYLDQTPGHTR